MSQVIDKLERSQNHKRGYRNGTSESEAQASIVFIPRYMKYVIPALQIGLGVLSVAMLCAMLLAR